MSKSSPRDNRLEAAERQRVIVREACALHLRDRAERRPWTDRARRRYGVERPHAVHRLVDVARDAQVVAVRPEVGDRRGQIAGQLALHVDIPRAQRGVAQLRVDGDRREADRLRKADGAAERNRAAGGQRCRKRRVARACRSPPWCRADRPPIHRRRAAPCGRRRPMVHASPSRGSMLVVVLAIDPVDVHADAHERGRRGVEDHELVVALGRASCAIRSAAPDRASATGRS